MANFDTAVQRARVEFARFFGLGRSVPLCGEKSSYELRNFRLLSDGSMQRREGFLPLTVLPSAVRGVFSTVRQGQTQTYAVAGSEVYVLERSGPEWTARAIGSLNSTQGKVCFFCYDSSVLLLDGKDVWTLTPERAFKTPVYVPLYGDGWDMLDSTSWVVNERPNLLTSKLRVRFWIKSANRVSLSTLAPASVDAALVNGKPYNTWQYDATKQELMLGVLPPSGSLLEIYVTMPEGAVSDPARVTCASRADVIGDGVDGQVVFYGGGVPSGRLWMSRVVPQESALSVREQIPDACMLYVTSYDLLTVGDGLQPITGTCRHYGRSLIFTSGGTFMTDEPKGAQGRLAVKAINSRYGCSTEGGCCVSGNAPMTVWGKQVLCWNSNTDEPDECNAHDVSASVSSLFDADFGQTATAICHPSMEEVWFYHPGRGGRVFVRQQTGDWTTFDGFEPDGLFTLGERMGFFKGGELFAFDGSATVDTDAQGTAHPIQAEYASSFMDFGHVGRSKRICGGTVVAQGESLELTLRTVKGVERRVALTGRADRVSVMQSRARAGRFRFLRVGVRSECEGPLRVWGIRLEARG